MAFRQISDDFAEDVIEELISRLEAGEDMASICRDPRMPSVSTFWRWSKQDDDLGKRIVCAREVGYYIRADEAVAEAKTAEDAAKGRLAFDAERWRLSKLANAFSDKVKHVGGDEGDAPIRTEARTTLDVAGLNDDQLRALASIRIPTE